MNKLVFGSLTLTAGITAALILWRVNAADATSGVEREESVRVTRRDVGSVVKATGVIKPCVGAEVRVGARISGVVSRLHVKVGDMVNRGDLLAELDDRDLAARCAEADANLRRSVAERRFAEADLQRKRELHAAHVIAVSELDLAERACTVAQEQVAVAEAALAYARIQLDYTRIVAPIAGVVASVATQEGETVAASFAAPTFVTLIDLSRLEVWAYVDETDIGRIQPGQLARFTVDTYADESFDGVVTTIYPKAEIRDNVVNYVTVVRFEPVANRILRPEMTTTVRIALERGEAAVSVPPPAIRWADGRPFLLVRAGESIEQRWVKPGRQESSFCEITDGLVEGEEVLLGNVQFTKVAAP